MPDPLMTDAKAKLSGLETQGESWVKLHRVALILGFVVGALAGFFLRGAL